MDKHLDGKSFDNIQARIDELKRLFPEAVKEGRFDPELLLGLLEEKDETYGLNEERYDFTWKGKAESLRLAQRRSDGTLRPCFEEGHNWDTTQNLYIEGDNLEVMKLLQQGYLRSVKMIYIDPPYNTGNDFVYQDDFADPIAKYKEATGQGMRANPETAGRYHSNWLSMMYPRLKIAKTLLRDDGVIFISIDDKEVHNLRRLCDDVFGEENFVASIIWQKVYSPKNSAKHFSEDHDYIIVYAKKAENWRPTLLPKTDGMLARYNNPDNDPRGPWKPGDLSARNYYSKGTYQITCPGGRKIQGPPTGSYWRYSEENFQELDRDGRIWWGEDKNNIPAIKRFLSEVKAGTVPQTLWFYKDVGHTQEAKKDLVSLIDFESSDDVFETPKPARLIKQMLRIATTPNDTDIVLDFFAGSGTTAQAVLDLNKDDGGNRRFIVIQLPERLPSKEYPTIGHITRRRIQQSGERVRSEWLENKKKQTGSLPFDKESTPASALDVGFRAFKLDSSNLIKWDGSYVPPESANLFLGRAEHNLNNMKTDRRDIDLIYEVLLKYGVPLTEKLATLQIQGKTFYVVGDTGCLMICLESVITVEIMEDLIKAHTPGAIIFADECFADDSELTNAGLALEKAQIEFRWV